MPQTIFVQMDVQVITWLQNEATTLFADRKSAEKVKVPSTAARKSLPKRRKTGEKGRDSCSRRLEISTQTWKKREKGRESQSSPNLCVNSSSSYVSSSMLPLSSGDLIEWSLVCHSTLSYQKFCD